MKRRWRRDPPRGKLIDFRRKRKPGSKLHQFWPDAARPRLSGWMRYMPLWLGAVLVGLAAGIGPALVSSRGEPTEESGQGNAAPLPHRTTQEPTREDLEWERRAQATSLDRSDEAGPSDRPGAAVRLHFSSCFVGGGTNCVVDGDTIWLDGRKIRILDIDAPETHDPGCAEEKALGDRATERLQVILNSGMVTLRSAGRDEDRYGRKLRIVEVDGQSVGDMLVGEGLARPYGSGRQPWC